MNNLIKTVSLWCILLATQFIVCSLPSNNDPVEWKMRSVLPIAHDRYTARDLLPTDASGGLHFSFGKKDSVADTVVLTKKDTLLYTIERPLITTDTSRVQELIGALTLQNTPTVDLLFLLSNDELSAYSGMPLPQPVTFVQSKDDTLDGIESVSFDESSPALVVNVHNTSQSGKLENVRITLFDSVDTIGQFDTSAIPAQSSLAFSVPVQNKQIHTIITVAVDAVVSAGSILGPGEGLHITFTLNSLIASGATIVDSMIEYSDTITGHLTIADSIRIDAIDLEQASLLCEVKNPCAFKLQLSGFIEDAWKREYASAHNILKLDKNTMPLDSSMFAGNVLFDTLFKTPAEYQFTKSINLTDLRLFPSWNSDSGTSILQYRYTTKALSDGRFVTFHKNDTITFILAPVNFPFIQIWGVFTKKMTESFSSLEKVGFEWNKAITDSLRKAFRFTSVAMMFDFTPALPQHSEIDSLQIDLTLSNPDSLNVKETIQEKMSRIVPDSIYSSRKDISRLVNTWPDSLSFEGSLGLPAGTGIVLHNSKDADGNYSSKFTIGINIGWSINIPLAWAILDTIRTELEQSNFTVEYNALEWANKFKQKKVGLALKILNNTNLSFLLFALGAEKANKADLDAFQWNESKYSKLTIPVESKLVAFTGPDGVHLGPRGTYNTINLELDDKGIKTILSEKGCYIRWFLIIPRSARSVGDALCDTDFLEINASAVINGIANSDSLLYAKELQ